VARAVIQARMIDSPSGAVFRNNSFAAKAFVYQAIARATPLTTNCGVMV
jgi:hypothetical protein